jgi:hypothetical protein
MIKPIKTLQELGEELCKYCPLPKECQGAYSSPGGLVIGCEGSHCDKAYEIYLDVMASDS